MVFSSISLAWLRFGGKNLARKSCCTMATRLEMIQ